MRQGPHLIQTTSKAAKLGVLFLAITSLAACLSDETTPVGPEAELVVGTHSVEQQAFHLPRTIDEYYRDISEAVPGFGGMFFDQETQSVVAWLTDLEAAPEAREVIHSYLGRGDASPPEVRFQQGDYDFRDLDDWRRSFHTSAAENNSDLLTLTSVRKSANRIRIGVRTDGAVSVLTTALEELDIPAAAVIFEVIDPPPPMYAGVDLASMARLPGVRRPVRGGLAITTDAAGVSCTMGFVAARSYSSGDVDMSGPRYVTTNSHCTSEFGVTHGDTIGQPIAQHAIGVEFSDPPFVSDAVDPMCPSTDDICRRSDAALFELVNNSDTLSWFNAVATASGTTMTGATFYAGTQNAWMEGMTVSKIGRQTGETSGTIVDDCFYFVAFGGRILVCQQETTLPVDGGDSGSPVWYTDPQGQRWLFGILWGLGVSYWGYTTSEMANDILARTGQQWTPAFTNGPANYSTW